MRKIKKSTFITSCTGFSDDPGEKFHEQLGKTIEEYQSLELEVDIKYSTTQLNNCIVFSAIVLGCVEV